MTIRNLDALLAPRSAVLVGASAAVGSVGSIVARNLLAGGFKGPVWFVNPREAPVEGAKCYRSVDTLPGVPDIAVVATPPASIPGIIGELGAKGTRAAVVITAGLDPAAKQAMLQAAQPYCLRIQGPNCLGLMLPRIGLDAGFSHRAPLAGDLAFLSQSGALITSIIDWANARSIGFSHVVSLGDMADVDFGDLLDYLAADRASRAILLYMESVTNAPKFMSAARRAARAKPVVVIKSGRHAAGAKAAMSHTGALAGSDKAYEAAFRRAGILRVHALEELFDAAEILSRAPPLTGERLMILTNGGGAGVLAADRLADWRGTLAPLSENTRTALDRVLPQSWSRANPIDIIGDATPERYGRALDILMQDQDCDAFLIMNCPTALADSGDAARAAVKSIAESRTAIRSKPVLTAWLGDGTAEAARREFRQAGIPAFNTPDDAIDGFMQLARYARVHEQLMRTPPSLPSELAFETASAAGIIRKALAEGRTALDALECRALLAAYGIPALELHVAANADDAGRLASDMLGRHAALVLKIASRDVSHKSEAGGVALDLVSAAEVVDAARAMLAKVKSRVPGAHIDGFTLEPMVKRPRAHELLLGISVDSTFGPLITFGAGGTAVEVMRDTAQALPPLDLGLAHDLIRETRISRLLAGYRDRPAAALGDIALALVRLGYLAAAHPEIRELDINPLLADEAGVVALDARVSISDQTRDPRTPMSIRPYPSQWETVFEMASGQAIVIRPIRPDDETRYAAFFGELSPDDVRMRFFLPLKQLDHAFVARLTQIDYAREMAFVALAKPEGSMLGVVRFAADPDYKRGEFAVLVRSDLKGRGLGWKLMKHLVEYARAEGLAELSGCVLAENTTMLTMCRELGFSVSIDPEDAAVRIVRLAL